jgi:SAM-dependent methyltransferase
MGLQRLGDEALKEYFRREGTVSGWWNAEQGPFAYHFQSEFKAPAEFPAPASAARVLDVGTGRGMFAVWFARHGCRVDAADISAEMIAIAPDNVTAAGLGDRVTFHEGDADLSRFPEGGYDGVSCTHAFDHIPDLPKALEREVAIERMAGAGLTCLLLRPEFEMGRLTSLTRWISQVEERLVPLYRSRFLARRCQILLGLGRRR